MRAALMIGLVTLLVLSAGNVSAKPNQMFEPFELEAFVASLWDLVFEFVFGLENPPLPDPVGEELFPTPDPIG